MGVDSIDRLIFAANVLRGQGHDVRIVTPNSRHAIQGVKDPRDGGLLDVGAPPDADVMVFQRVTYAMMVDAFERFRARGIAVVVDVDDDLDRIDPKNPAWAMLHPKAGTGQSWVTAKRACDAATMVTVSTPALLPLYAPGGNGVVIPNFVPSIFHTIPRFDSPVFGWGGSLHSHAGDLPVVGDAVGRLMREGHQFRVVGPIEGVRDAMGLPWEPDSTGALPIQSWAQGLSTLGVGMAPLADTIFNKSKSRLKIIEKASLGVPTVFSPRADYMKLHQETGIGIPAGSPRVWYRELKKLITDDEYRTEKSAADRKASLGYTVDENAWRWMDVWTEALRRQRRGASSVFTRG